MPLNRLEAIGAAGGSETTTGTDQRRNETPVKPDPSQHQPGQRSVDCSEEGSYWADRYSGWFVHWWSHLGLIRFQQG